MKGKVGANAAKPVKLSQVAESSESEAELQELMKNFKPAEWLGRLKATQEQLHHIH